MNINQKKTVTFRNKIKARRIQRRKDIPIYEKHLCWYRLEEYQQMKNESTDLAEHLSTCGYSIDSLRSRGLEPLHFKRETKCTMMDSRWIVLDEQDDQKEKHHKLEEGEEAPIDENHLQQLQQQELATLASSLTMNCVQEAIERGVLIRQEVLHNVDDMDMEEERLVTRKPNPLLQFIPQNSSCRSSDNVVLKYQRRASLMNHRYRSEAGARAA